MKQLLITFSLILFGTILGIGQKMVSGVVTDQSGMPLIGASVVAKGAVGVGTITDVEGAYRLSLPENVNTLVFSYTGYGTREMEVGGASVINISLEEGSFLDEVVVVGYGVQRKSDVTSSISSVKGSDVATLISPTVTTQLAGRAAGVQVTTPNGILGEAPKVRIRGIASVNSGTDPLYVVDGMPIYSGYLGGEASASGLGDLNPDDIESYEVLKDGAATAIYGSRGANGVILITTKKGRKGATQISLNSSFGFANPVKLFDLLQTPDFLTIANEKRTNRGQAPWAIGSEFNT
ncbi:MAG: TonB-dependent receptor plug domain-containing protein, partial [Chitinophagales bacterium]|nr:TonB-dependent receptor plug domain-containing protein [Chitinophagales bacterium]